MSFLVPAPHDQSRLRPPATYPGVLWLFAGVPYAHGHCLRQMAPAFGATTVPGTIAYKRIYKCDQDDATVALCRVSAIFVHVLRVMNLNAALLPANADVLPNVVGQNLRPPLLHTHISGKRPR